MSVHKLKPQRLKSYTNKRVKSKVSMVTARLRTARLQQTSHDTTEILEKWLHTVGYLKRMYHRFRLLRRCGMSTEASWRVGWTVTPISPWWQPKRTLSRKSTTLLLKQKSFTDAIKYAVLAPNEQHPFVLFFYNPPQFS